MPTLTTPVSEERVPGRELWWVKERKGISLVKVDGTWGRVRYPSQVLVDTLTEGTNYFCGGHQYSVTSDMQAELIAAGVVTADNFS